jgi:hypothetical protein
MLCSPHAVSKWLVTAGWPAFMVNFFSPCPGLFAPARYAGMSQNVHSNPAPEKIEIQIP